MKLPPIIDVGALFQEQADKTEVLKQITEATVVWGAYYMVNHGLASANFKDLHKSMKQLFDADADSVPGHEQFCKELMPSCLAHTWIEANVIKKGELPPDEPRKFLYYGKYKTDKLPECSAYNNLRNDIDDAIQKFENVSKTLLQAYCNILRIPADAAPVDYDMSELGMFRYEVDDYVAMPKDEEVVVGHTDTGYFSLSFSEIEGLAGLDRSGVWHCLPPVTDAIIVHVSDTLEHVSGGVFRSFPHRVTPPTCDRQSLVYFFYPSMNSTMAPVDVPEEIKLLKDGLSDARWPLLFHPPMRFNDYAHEVYKHYFPDTQGDWTVTK